MKLVRYQDGSGVKLGVVKGEGIIDLTKPIPSISDNMHDLITCWPDLRADAELLAHEATPDVALADVRLLAPVARPGKVMAIGLNYADHIKETGQKMPVPPENSKTVEKSSDFARRSIVLPACSNFSRSWCPGSLAGFVAARSWN